MPRWPEGYYRWGGIGIHSYVKPGSGFDGWLRNWPWEDWNGAGVFDPTFLYLNGFLRPIV